MSSPDPHELSAVRRLIGQRVRALRHERHWTQRELAEALGLSQNRLSELERGKGSFTAEQFLALLRLFNVDAASFEPRLADESAELQNALIRHGARHLREVPGVAVSDRFRRPLDVLRNVLLEPNSERFVTALAPVLVWSLDEISLALLQDQLAHSGVPNRLGWLIDNTLAAIYSAPPDAKQSIEWRRRLKRAVFALYTFKEQLQFQDPSRSKVLDLFDPGIRTLETRDRVWSEASEISHRWSILTALQVDDFAEALWWAVGSDR